MENKELQAGTTLHQGKYIVERKLGAGGFGITYYVLDRETGTHYAIKEFFLDKYCLRNTATLSVQLYGISSERFNKFRLRFAEEAQLLTSLDHVNIVKALDVFHENNTSYFVMPYIAGKSLQKLIETQGRLEYGTIAVNYMTQLCSAVQYIHRRGILHRDIKPDNILITPDNKVMLIDFGSARTFIHDQTQRQTVLLTRGYAPLEQYSETSRKGNYTDIYSLGAVLYFMMTGTPPEYEGTVRASEVFSSGKPDPLKEPRSLNPAIPLHVNNCILKAMNIRPENRYQQVDDFMTDLLNTSFSGEDIKNIKVITVGRNGQNNDIVINDPKVSRYHLQIIREKGSFRIRDLNSHNGTFVNGKRISGETILFPGDTVQIGSTLLPWASYFKTEKSSEATDKKTGKNIKSASANSPATPVETKTAGHFFQRIWRKYITFSDI